MADGNVAHGRRPLDHRRAGSCLCDYPEAESEGSNDSHRRPRRRFASAPIVAWASFEIPPKRRLRAIGQESSSSTRMLKRSTRSASGSAEPERLVDADLLDRAWKPSQSAIGNRQSTMTSLSEDGVVALGAGRDERRRYAGDLFEAGRRSARAASGRSANLRSAARRATTNRASISYTGLQDARLSDVRRKLRERLASAAIAPCRCRGVRGRRGRRAWSARGHPGR